MPESPDQDSNDEEDRCDDLRAEYGKMKMDSMDECKRFGWKSIQCQKVNDDRDNLGADLKKSGCDDFKPAYKPEMHTIAQCTMMRDEMMDSEAEAKKSCSMDDGSMDMETDNFSDLMAVGPASYNESPICRAS